VLDDEEDEVDDDEDDEDVDEDDEPESEDEEELDDLDAGLLLEDEPRLSLR
jgi:hypothetical protein